MLTAEESDFQTVECPAEPLSLTYIDASDDENEVPTTVIETLPDDGKLTLKEVVFKTNKVSTTVGRLYETDKLREFENAKKVTWIPSSFCNPETTRHIRELSALQTVKATALNPYRTEDRVIEMEPNPVPATDTNVEPLAGALKLRGSNVSLS